MSEMPERPISWNELIERYAAGPSRLKQILTGLPDQELDLAASPESWSIRKIIHHIVDGDDIWNTCIKAALGNPEGEFSLKWYWDQPQTEWAESWQYQNRSIETSLDLFRANRAVIVDLLLLIPNGNNRSINIRWPGDMETSRITVEDVVKMHDDHIEGHLEDIRTIKGLKK